MTVLETLLTLLAYGGWLVFIAANFAVVYCVVAAIYRFLRWVGP